MSDHQFTDPVLAGIVVLDLSQYLAGPSCTRMLAELGADVIKVEFSPYGDPSRSFSPRVNRRSGFFVQQNRGKRSVCVDFSNQRGVAIIRDLARKVDVLVENFSPGVMDRKGLGYEILSQDNPGLVMTSISGFGQTGPLAHKPAFDFVAQAYSGLMHMTGEPDGPPMMVGIAIADSNVGVHAFGAIGHALFRRERTGAGSYLDIAMVDALVHMQESAVSSPGILGETYEPMRQGRFYQVSQPGGVYRSPEGWVAIFCTQGQMANLWAALGRPELAEDSRFAKNDGRVAHRDELTEIIESWMAGFETEAEVLEIFDRHRVPSSRVNKPSNLAGEAHLRERGMIRDVPDPRIGSVTTPGFPIRFAEPRSPKPLDLNVLAPKLGEHNREVLVGLLGFDGSAVDELETAGVLFAKDA